MASRQDPPSAPDAPSVAPVRDYSGRPNEPGLPAEYPSDGRDRPARLLARKRRLRRWRFK